MKYLIAENHMSYSIAIDQDGRFLRVANLGYTEGQYTDAVIQLEESRNVRRFPVKTAIGVLAAIAACLLLVFLPQSHDNVLTQYATVRISINPRLSLDISQEKDVLAVQALNDDGQRISDMLEYDGRKLEPVLEDIVTLSMDEGMLIEGGGIDIDVECTDTEWQSHTGEGLKKHLDAFMHDRLRVNITLAEPAESTASITTFFPSITTPPATASSPPASTTPPAITTPPVLGMGEQVSETATATVKPSPTQTEKPTATVKPSPTQTEKPAATLKPSPTKTTKPTATLKPSPTNTTKPTATLKPSPTNTTRPTVTVKPSPTKTAKPTDTLKPSPTKTAKPTATHPPDDDDDDNDDNDDDSDDDDDDNDDDSDDDDDDGDDDDSDDDKKNNKKNFSITPKTIFPLRIL